MSKVQDSFWMRPEWGFAKGRRNYQEKNIVCALREFEEETGYNSNLLTLIQNLEPLEEVFTGSNHKSYKHIYYLANLENIPTVNVDFQKSEVSEMKWLTFEEAIQKIRPYNIEKIEILKRVNKLLLNYKII